MKSKGNTLSSIPPASSRETGGTGRERGAPGAHVCTRMVVNLRFTEGGLLYGLRDYPKNTFKDPLDYGIATEKMTIGR